MANETFKLNFITNGEGIKTIDEPVGFDAADFTLKQKDKGYSRDISFAGGESEFTFYRMRKHQFETLIHYYEFYGWEGEVQLIIETSQGDSIIGDLDFYEAETDLLEYFTCKVIQQKKEALVKKRQDVKVDLFADKDLDDNDITPLSTENVLVLAKPIKQQSNWETSNPFYGALLSAGNKNTTYYYFNPAFNLAKQDIDDSLSFFSPISVDANEFKIITASNNLTNLTIDISNLDLDLETSATFDGDGYIDLRFILAYGSDFNTATEHVFFTAYLTKDESYSNNNNYSFELPFLNRGNSIWLYFSAKVRQSATTILGTPPVFLAETQITSMDVDIQSISKSYNTVVPSLRLYDAVSQNVNAISQLPTSFEFAQSGGEMYDQRVLNGNMLRGITDKPFYFTLKQVKEWLQEINGDYEVSESDVYFGLYKDFYKDFESGVFTSVKFDDYKKTFNKKYALNQFNFSYNKYQSQKESDVENTYDILHGESEWLLGNVFVENKKEIKIPFVRDAFMIGETQRKSLTESETTATQDDDTIYILDTIKQTEDTIFEETDFLQHSYDSGNNKLTLTNDGSFNWVLLGLGITEYFYILGGDPNAGTYTVYQVSNRKLILNRVSGGGTTNGERNTLFKYSVSTVTAPYKIWTDEEFTLIDNVASDDSFANLKYSIKRNVTRFWNEYLATANLYAKKLIKNTFYKNNSEAILVYNGEQTTESESFTPDSPILSPNVHNVTVITDFAAYNALKESVRSQRGYIRIVDRTDFVLKLYPQDMTYVNNAELGELTIIGEEKYEPSYIKIVNDGGGFIVINDNYITQRLVYKNKQEKFYIFDETETLLFRPCLWYKISVNGVNADSKEELIEWLDLLT